MAIACSWINQPARRVWVWCGAHAAARLALAPLTPVPDAAPLDPLALCLAGALASSSRKQMPLAVTLMLAGLLAGDLAAGLPVFSVVVRVAGFLALLWIKPKNLNGIWFALWFAVHHAVWTAAGSEAIGLFAFPHVYAVSLTQHVLFLASFAHLLQKGESPRRSAGWILALVPLLVLLSAVLMRPFRLWPPPRLGNTWGWSGALVVLPLLFLPFLPLLLQRAKPTSPGNTRKPRESNLSWKDLMG